MRPSRFSRILEKSPRCVEERAGKKGAGKKEKDFQIKIAVGKHEGVKHHDAIAELYSSLVCL